MVSHLFFRLTSYVPRKHLLLLALSSNLFSNVIHNTGCKSYHQAHDRTRRKSSSSKTSSKKSRPHAPPTKPKSPIPFLHSLKQIHDPDSALSLFSEFQRMGFKHDYPSYSSLIYKLARSRDFSKINPILRLMKSRNIRCQEALFIALMRHYAKCNLIDDCVSLFHQIPTFNCSRSLQSFNTLLNGLVDNDRFSDANEMFKNSSKLGFRPNCVTFNIIIKGWLEKGEAEKACLVFDEMLDREIQPSTVTYNSLIGYLSRGGEPDKAMKLLNDMIGRGKKPNAVSYALVMEGLCKLGRDKDARKVMFDMEYHGCKPKVVNYGVLMNDLASKGGIEEARLLLVEMRKKGMRPDVAAYNVIINYLCKEGGVEQAYKVMVEMQLKGGCEPNAATYRMMVDGFCKVGEFGRGVGVLNAMLMERHCPRLETWKCLGVGLLRGGEMDEALFVVEEMMKRKLRFGVEDWEDVVRERCWRDHQLDDEFLDGLISS